MPALRKRNRAAAADLSAVAEEQDFLNAQADMGAERLERYRRFEAYYEGEHRLQLTARQKTFLGHDFIENFVETVVDALADRLAVTGFQVEDNADASAWLTGTAWPKSGGAHVQNVVHTMVPTYGDGFVICEMGDDGLPRARWNRPHNIKPVYDDETGELLHLVKVWSTSRKSASNPSGVLIRRMNLYFPERIEKYFAAAAGDDAVWARHMQDAPDEEWPVVWTMDGDPAGEPIGILGFHFRHKPLGRTYGRSRVKGAIPFQNELSKQLLDLFEIRDQQGWPQRYAAGIPDGAKLLVKIGEIITSSNAETRFGQFDAADIDPLLNDMAATLTRLSAKTRTPLHDLITGTPPSGEALKTAEGGIVLEAGDCHVEYGGPWAGVGGMFLRLAEVFGEDLPFEYDADQEVTAVWDDPQSRNELQEAQTAQEYRDLGVSQHTLLRRLGFDPDEELALRAKEPSDLPELP